MSNEHEQKNFEDSFVKIMQQQGIKRVYPFSQVRLNSQIMLEVSFCMEMPDTVTQSHDETMTIV